MSILAGGSNLNIANGIREFEVATPNQTAVIDGARSLTYAQLADRSRRVANGLIGAGLQTGSRVALHMGNRLEYFEIACGIAMAGMVIVPVNPRSLSHEVEYIAGSSDALALIVDNSLAQYSSTILSAMKLVWVLDGPRADRDYEMALAASSSRDPRVDVGELETFCIMYTSGTTGTPKGVQISHRSRVLTFYAAALEWDMGPDRRSIAVAPLYHGAGFAFGYAGVFTGGTVSVLRTWDPVTLLEMIQRDRAESMFLVPTHAQTIRAFGEDELRKVDLSSLKTIYFNAAALPKELKEWVIGAFPGVGVHELYGSTEAAVVTDLRPRDAVRKIGSVGKPWFMTELRVVDDAGDPVRPGEPGELFARSPYLMSGYLGDPEATAACTTADGFLTSGDVVILDEEGFIYVVDRKKDMVISGGLKIYPREVENTITSHPDVREAAVVGVPSEKWGESLAAFVVLNSETKTTTGDLQSYVEPLLANFKRPAFWRVVESLPRNAGGKVVKRELSLESGQEPFG